MTPGKEVRLKNAYIVKCTGCTKDENGVITEIQAEYDPISKSGMEGANRKVKGTLHWVSADHCVKAEVREYDRLFMVEIHLLMNVTSTSCSTQTASTTILTAILRNMLPTRSQVNISSSSVSVISWPILILLQKTSIQQNRWLEGYMGKTE